MNVVERQISAAATQRTSCVFDVGSRKMNGWSMTPIPSRIVLQIAELREDRRPGDTGGEIRDRERQQEDVEEEPAELELRVQEQGHAEREDELDRHDHEDQEEREAHRLGEGGVVHHRVDRAPGPVARPRRAARARSPGSSATRRTGRGRRRWEGSASTAADPPTAVSDEPAASPRRSSSSLFVETPRVLLRPCTALSRSAGRAPSTGRSSSRRSGRAARPAR